uniref:S1 motif domain-containing protein n=1 Tax=Schistocephalus solidus TaxID=70667 RepID=A0A0X3Q7M7_SCHSO
MPTEKVCLGRVKSVGKFYLDVSLPFGATGRVKIADVNAVYYAALEKLVSGGQCETIPLLNDMFSTGQVVRCCVKSSSALPMSSTRSPKRLLDLTLDPAHVNANMPKDQLPSNCAIVGCIKSIEDRGYVVEMGIKDTLAFMPFQETQSGGAKLPVGSLVSVRVDQESQNTKGISSRAVRVALITPTDKPPTLSKNPPIAFECLLPGVLLNVKLQSFSVSHIQATFQSFTVLIPFEHCESAPEVYAKGSTHTVCVISIDFVSKEVYASLLSYLVSISPDSLIEKVLQVGTRLNDAIIERTTNHSVYLRTPSANNARVVLQKNQAFDETPPKKWTAALSKEMPLTCRVIDLNLFDNVAIVTRKTEILTATFLSISDVKAGAKVTATVRKFDKGGVVVRIGGKLRGLIPYMHLSDVAIKKPEDRFKRGDKIKCRVLVVNKEDGKLLLTAKKSLLSSELPILGSAKMRRAWSKLLDERKTRQEPMLVLAFVVHVSEKGVLVSGVNNVRGWVPKKETFAASSPSITQFFSRGQTLRFRVLRDLTSKVDASKSKKPTSQFLLSQKVDFDAPAQPLKPVETLPVLVGKVYYGVVKRIDETVLVVGLFDSPEVPTACPSSTLADATLPYTHLSDSSSNAALFRKHASALFHQNSLLALAGDVALQLVVLNVTSEFTQVSAKPSLVRAAVLDCKDSDSMEKPEISGFVRTFNQLTIGSQWYGWVAQHKEYGVFIHFPSGLRGLAPIRYLADRRAPPNVDWTSVYPAGATVEAKVVEIGVPEKQRCLVSLRMLDVYADASQQYLESALNFAYRCLRETQWLCEHVNRFKRFSYFAIGDRVRMTISRLESETYFVGTATLIVEETEKQESLPPAPSAPAVVFLPNTVGVECAVGQTYTGVVAMVNLQGDSCSGACLEVSLEPWLARAVEDRCEDLPAMRVKLNQVIPSSVVSIGNGVVVAALKQHALGRMAVLPARRCFNDVLGANSWSLTQSNRVTIRREITEAAPESTHRSLFLCTFNIHDPLTAAATGRKNVVLSSLTEHAAQEGNEVCALPKVLSVLPRVVFIGLKGRVAFFRVHSLDCRSRNVLRVFCRLINAVSTAKAARHFVNSPPPVGTIFKDALVLRPAIEDRVTKRCRGSRLPLTSSLTEISLSGKTEPAVGDLVCAQVLGTGALCWRLLLPGNVRGVLHVTCMSWGRKTGDDDADKSSPATLMPRAPKQGAWITCRVIDRGEKEKAARSRAQGPPPPTGNLASGTAVVRLDQSEDASNGPARVNPVFYVSTVASDLRQWRPENFKPLVIQPHTVYRGYVRKRGKDFLVVSLSYKDDVTVPLRAGTSSSTAVYQVGAPVQITIISRKTMTGQLIQPPVAPAELPSTLTTPCATRVRRKRTLSSCVSREEGEDAGAATASKLRCQTHSGVPDSGPSLNPAADLQTHFAEFFPPMEEDAPVSHTVDLEDQVQQDVDEKSELPVEPARSSLHSTLEKESRIAAIAQATARGSVTSSSNDTRLPLLTSVEEFEVAVRNSPSNPRLWVLYAAYHQDRGQVCEARSVYERALKLSHTLPAVQATTFTSTLLLAALNFEIRVQQQADSASDRQSQPPASQLSGVIVQINQLNRDVLTRKAIEALSVAGLHAHAEDLARKMVKSNAANADCWLALIKARFRAGKLILAREAQRNAARLLRVVHLPHFAVGCARLEFEFGDVDRAMSLFDEQLAAHPGRKALYTGYVSLLLAAGKTDEARNVISRALEKLPPKDHESLSKLLSDMCSPE